MKICLAQTQSLKGKVQKNLQNHLAFVERAVQLGADLIVFPELSITSYEPELAKDLVFGIEDEIFNPFQKKADQNDLVIGIGIPVQAPNGITISMLIFQPNQERSLYSKRLLHEDERPYFVSGSHQPFLNIKGVKIGLGICYETLQRSHFVHAAEHGADIYIASVAKPDRGVAKAYLHFPSVAKEFGIPILMVNCVGYCDNFNSNGKSSAWNKNGALLGQLEEENQGLLLYDTEIAQIKTFLNVT